MYIADNKVVFGKCDNAFVNKFGYDNAADMVLDYKLTHNTPFIYDSYQLADCLGVGRKELFLQVKNCQKMYSKVLLAKHNGGFRTLNIPNRFLKHTLHQINRKILSDMPISRYATAYAKGKNVIDNAKPHINKKYILKLDISDFFGSITFEQVMSKVFNTSNFPKNIGVMLAKLCCYKDYLPQGSPTSPALSNLVMVSFDNYIGQWCANRGVSYTRYCDDMTFSGNMPLGFVYGKVKFALESMGFSLNRKKTKFIANTNRQSVTSITVNEKASVSKDYKRKLRQEIFYVIKYGAADALLHTKNEAFFVDKKPIPYVYLEHLIGKTNYILQIEPENSWFQNANSELKKQLRNI